MTKMIDYGPKKDEDQFKADALLVAQTLRCIRQDVDPETWKAIQRFWRYMEADAFLPQEILK